jgi:3',5'-cyclic AMP phosphodiesterase CpdA
MTRLVHLTDLHFGAHDPDVVEALIADINANPPDLVAISGDLTQGGHHAEFRQARAFMDRLHAPNLTVPGNHDISPYDLWERFTKPYARWHREVRMPTEPDWSDGTIAVVGLNTARRAGWHWDWSRGRVTHKRLQRLVSRLDALPPNRIRVVVAHHPLLPPETEPQTRVAGGAARALSTFANHNVSLVLAGHLHRGYARLASVGGGPPLVVQGSTATSTRLRGEPNAYNRITILPGQDIEIEIRVWEDRAWRIKLAKQADPATLTGDRTGPAITETLADNPLLTRPPGA